uniref:Uncharacterized protein n=1 Tax=viral metagenome TaxID=1070528 RepID=A0A6M3J628_9ZZZZ
MNEYVLFEDLKRYLGIDSTETDDDTLLSLLCEAASRIWDGWTARRFYPRSETRYYDHPERDSSILLLDDDLLEVTTLTTENTGTTIGSTDRLLRCGRSWNMMPYDRVELKSDGTTTTFSFSGTPQKANALTGIWGYHEDWANAWVDSQDTTENDPLAAAGTSITVNDADGANLYGTTPRFKVGQLLKIESEYLYVSAKSETTNALTVVRGVNGTTAAAHDQNTAIYIYQPMHQIVQAVKRLAGYLYKQKDSQVFDVTAFPEAGVMEIPQGLPRDVKLLIPMYRKSTVR